MLNQVWELNFDYTLPTIKTSKHDFTWLYFEKKTFVRTFSIKIVYFMQYVTTAQILQTIRTNFIYLQKI